MLTNTMENSCYEMDAMKTTVHSMATVHENMNTKSLLDKFDSLLWTSELLALQSVNFTVHDEEGLWSQATLKLSLGADTQLL